jgi:hypothetical protein
MFAWKSLLFNDLLASIATTAHICARIPVYFGEFISSVLMLLFPVQAYKSKCSTYFVFVSHYYIHGYNDQNSFGGYWGMEFWLLGP